MRKEWFLVSDRLLDHPKFVRLEKLVPSRGVHLWLGLMSYCKQNRTDGVVPVDDIRYVRGPALGRWRAEAFKALEQVGLVEFVPGDASEGRASEWRMHDYLEWQPSSTHRQRKTAGRNVPSKKLAPVLDLAERRATDPRVSDNHPTGQPRLIHRPVDVHRDVVSNDVTELEAPSRVRARLDGYGYGDGSEIPSFPPLAAVAEPVSPPAAPSKKKSGRSNGTGGRLSKTQCDPGFEPTTDVHALALRLGFAVKHELRVRASFVDYWRGRGVAMADWQATYRNWLRREAEKLGLKPPPPLMRQGEFVGVDKPKRAGAELVPPPPGYHAAKNALFRGGAQGA